MSKEDDFKVLKIQTCVLKVNIHCDGCKQKVKKLLQKIEGVYTTLINAENGRVTVTGNVDPEALIKKLLKAGKHAELISPKLANNQQLNNQFQNLLIDNSKGKKDGKSQKGKNDKKSNLPPQQQLQQMKMFKDLKLPFKDQKSVKFDFPDEGDFTDDDGFSDEFCEDDDYDDDFEDDLDVDPRKSINAHGMGNNQQPAMKVNIVNDKKATGNGKKGGEIPVPNKTDSKNGVKKGGALPPKNAGKDGNGAPNNKCSGNGVGGGNKIPVINNSNTKKNGKIDMCNGFQDFTAIKGACEPLMGNQMGQMGHTPAVQGLPAMNAAPYLHGVPPPDMIAASPAGNPQYQQYLQMMMNQQRQNERYQQLMYCQQPPPVTYYPQPMPTAPYAHFFSDENANSCSVM